MPVHLLVLLAPEGEDAGEHNVQQHAAAPDVTDLALIPAQCIVNLDMTDSCIRDESRMWGFDSGMRRGLSTLEG